MKTGTKVIRVSKRYKIVTYVPDTYLYLFETRRALIPVAFVKPWIAKQNKVIHTSKRYKKLPGKLLKVTILYLFETRMALIPVVFVEP